MNSAPIVALIEPAMTASMNPASAARQPDMACALITRRAVGMPDSSAAFMWIPASAAPGRAGCAQYIQPTTSHRDHREEGQLWHGGRPAQRCRPGTVGQRVRSAAPPSRRA